MATLFTAHLFGVHASDVHDTLVVAVAESVTGSSLEFQRQLSPPSPQDAERGADTYCLVRDQVHTCYGGLTSYTCADDLLVLSFTPEAAAQLALPDAEAQIPLDLPAGQAEEVARELERVLEVAPAVGRSQP